MFLKDYLRRYKLYNIISSKKNNFVYLQKKYTLPIKKWRKNNKNGVFFVFSPFHGNLGDHAIAYSVTNILQKENIQYYELTVDDLLFLQSQKKLKYLNGFPVLVNGGGNLGTLWFDFELLFRNIIHENPKSEILCLPNTMYYEDTQWGNCELEKSVAIYNSHNKLRLYAREEISYKKMSMLYKDVKLVPDMVLALEQQSTSVKREGCILCFRKDNEKLLNTKEIESVKLIVKDVFDDKVEELDTDHSEPISKEDRERELHIFWEKLQQAEIMITDRLHGMIFAAITATPCIVINSKSPKIKGCYEWIKHLGYIRFCENYSDLYEMINNTKDVKGIFDNRELIPYYQILIDDINRTVR